MTDLIATVLAAVAAFAATNIDDIFLLAVYFTQTSNSTQKRRIVLGQYIGFIIILALSMIGFVAGLVIPEQLIGLLGFAPIYMGIRQLLRGRKDNSNDETVDLADQPKPQLTSWLTSILHPKTYSVAVVTLANGGDNISVYTPLLAGKTLSSLGVTLVVFMLLIAVWCFLGDRVGSNPVLARLIQHYAHLIVPFVLIGLGIYILIESGLFAV